MHDHPQTAMLVFTQSDRRTELRTQLRQTHETAVLTGRTRTWFRFVDPDSPDLRSGSGREARRRLRRRRDAQALPVRV